MEATNERDLLKQLMDESKKTLQSYAAGLKRLNENHGAALEAMQRQAEEIVATREVAIRHEKELAECRELIGKLVRRVFGDPEKPSSSKPQPN